GCEADLARELGGRRLPVQPAGDHQVQNQKPLALEGPYDPLADPEQVDDAQAVQFARRWIDAAQEERTCEIDAFEHLTLCAWPKLLDVDGDVGKLGHRRDMFNRRKRTRSPSAAPAPGWST